MNQQPPTTHLFTLHSRNWQDNTYVYPVISRRSKGLSVGINLNIDKRCNFACVYCCVDRSDIACRTEVDVKVLEQELDDMLGWVESGDIWQTPPFDHTPPALRRFNDVAFSGNGEPTASAAFAPACELTVKLLQQHHLPDAKIVVITNATLLQRPNVREALAYLDGHHGEIWAKLDAGNEKQYQQIVRSAIPLSRVVENIQSAGQSRAIVIQSMFLAMGEQPPSAADLADYVQRLCELRQGGCHIKLVQVYTIARPVFAVDITPLSNQQLDHIVSLIRAAGLPAEPYYAIPANR